MSARVEALRVATGTGKTRSAARLVADKIKRLRAEGDTRAVAYFVARHRLGDDFAALFREQGVSARVFRGREADDPDRPGQTMCDDLPAVEIAISLGASVSTSCCKGKRNRQTVKCSFYERCSYQWQTKERKPDVWIFAHQALFHAQGSVGEVAAAVIDEGFWNAGLWAAKRGLTIDEIEAPIALTKSRLDDVVADLEPLRRRLARALRRQERLGGLERQHLVAQALTAEDCTTAHKLEWQLLKSDEPLYPGMPPEARRKAVEAARHAKHVRSFTRLWTAARELLDQHDEAAVSGRLFLAHVHGDHGLSRVVRTRGVGAIAKQWGEAPTFIMDATLPHIAILRAFYPTVEIVANIDSALPPHVTVRQVLAAPVSANKLIRNRDEDGNRALWSIRRAILHRHLEVGRKPTLVIAQKSVAEWLKPRLPAGISVEWFNNISGRDDYRNVQLLIAVGRTLPNVIEVEAYAGALTGIEPIKTAEPAERGKARWYDKTTRGIRLKDGTGYAVEGDEHPDEMAEAIRWQICEGELVQAIGRARGINRTAATPLTVEVWADVVLPLTVDEVVPWERVPAGAEVEMLADGIWLDSPSDMAKCWPKVWPTEAAAKQWRERFTRSQTPIDNIFYRDLGPCGRYQLPGARQKWRSFRYCPDVVLDPRTWLESRLGPLAGFEVAAPHAIGILDALFAAAVRREPKHASRLIACSEPRHDEPASCHRGHLRLCGLEIAL